MLALVVRSIFCKFDSSCSAVHGLPVAAKHFDFVLASRNSLPLAFTVDDFDDFDDFKPIFEADAPSTLSLDGTPTFARFVDVFVVVAFALLRSFAISLDAKLASFSSSEEIDTILSVFGNFLRVFVGDAFLLTDFCLEILHVVINEWINKLAMQHLHLKLTEPIACICTHFLFFSGDGS